MSQRQRVCVIGAGAAGMASAWALARSGRFEVEVWEKTGCAGGVATSENLELGDAEVKQASSSVWINDGVQGGAPSYRNTLLFHKMFGFEPSKVHMTVSFGKGDKLAWNNQQDSALVQRLAPEIARFGSVLRWVFRLELLFIFVPIRSLLRLLRFSDDFCNHMVYPLTALFFGTGNQTPHVSAAVIARVFLDPELRLFDYDSHRLLSQTPEMFAFPSLRDIYGTVAKHLETDAAYAASPSTSSSSPTSTGHVVRLNHPAYKVVRCGSEGVLVFTQDGRISRFDNVIFACDAENALRILSDATWIERLALGNVRYFDDITLTHTDETYMRNHYEIDDGTRGDQYYVRTDPDYPDKIEMSFDLSNYQPQLRKGDKAAQPSIARRIYQTIFLDVRDARFWTIGAIEPSRVVLRKWWRCFSHTWSHFATAVPLMRFLQGGRGGHTANSKRAASIAQLDPAHPVVQVSQVNGTSNEQSSTVGRTFFCGSYTLFNTHEIAVISGLAAAYRLGAPYPFADDALAAKQFELYLNVIHGSSMKPQSFDWIRRVGLLGAAILIFALLIALFK